MVLAMPMEAMAAKPKYVSSVSRLPQGGTGTLVAA